MAKGGRDGLISRTARNYELALTCKRSFTTTTQTLMYRVRGSTIRLGNIPSLTQSKPNYFYYVQSKTYFYPGKGSKELKLNAGVSSETGGQFFLFPCWGNIC